MPCLPGFHPSFEDLHELWDLKLVTCIAPPGTSFCRVPPWVRGEPYCTADPQSSNPLHTKVCVYICTPETTTLWNSRASFFHCTQLSCPENPSLTKKIAVRCSQAYTAPWVGAAALPSSLSSQQVLQGVQKGDTPILEKPELSLPFSPSPLCPRARQPGIDMPWLRSCQRSAPTFTADLEGCRCKD